jgi:hypothetical protein
VRLVVYANDAPDESGATAVDGGVPAADGGTAEQSDGTAEQVNGMGDETPGEEDAPDPYAPRLFLPVMSPSAGDSHGVFGAHRQGDLCDVLLLHPLSAEVHGFGYRRGVALTEGVSDVTAGYLVWHDPSTWRGMLFRPDEVLDFPAEIEALKALHEANEDPPAEDGG